MSKSIALTLMLAVFTMQLGMAHASKRLGSVVKAGASKPLGGSSKPSLGKAGFLGGKKNGTTKSSGNSLRGTLTPLGAADHPLELEAALKQADSVASPVERRKAIAKVQKKIAKYDRKQKGQTWAKGIEAANIQTVYDTRAQEILANDALGSMSREKIWAGVQTVTAVLGIIGGLLHIYGGDGGNAVMASSALAVGFSNAGLAAMFVSKYQQAKGALDRAVEAGRKAFVRYAEFRDLTQRTGLSTND